MRAALGRKARVPAGAFAVVMATGAVSVASAHRLPGVSVVLLWVAVAACVAVIGLLAVRRFAGDRPTSGLRARRRRLDALTFVAAAGVLGVRLSGDGHPGAGIGCAIAAAIASVGIGATIGRSRTARRWGRPAGAWLLAVVATQSLVISFATIAHGSRRPSLAAAGLIGWFGGLVLYLALAGFVGRRTVELAARRQFRSDSWILMGALAISTLAAATLLRMPGVPLGSTLRLGGLLAWVGACAWIPILAGLDLWATAHRPAWGIAAGSRWSTVFPLGMYAAAAQAFGRADATAPIARAGQATMWVALLAWALVAAAATVSFTSRLRPPACDRGR